MPAFNPGDSSADDTSGGSSSTSKVPSGYLSNGNYDIYTISDLYNQTMFFGNSTYNAKNLDYKGQDEGGTHTTYVPQMATVEDYMRNFAQLPAAQLKNVQAQLYAAGVYGTKAPNWGIYTDRDGQLMGTVIRGYLGQLNMNAKGGPQDFRTYLAMLAKGGIASGINGGGGGGGGAARAPLQLTSTKTLNEVGNTQGQSELGRELASPEQAKFVSAYHGEEQREYNGGERAGDPTAEAKSHIDSTYKAEHEVHLEAGYAQQILQMLGVN